jgi:hypothetical protein
MSLITVLIIRSINDKEQSDDEPDQRRKQPYSLLEKVAKKTAKALLRLNNKKAKK